MPECTHHVSATSLRTLAGMGQLSSELKIFTTDSERVSLGISRRIKVLILCSDDCKNFNVMHSLDTDTN
jgi:hypothetical protein